MPSWKKVIVSGSDAHINHVTASGNISGSSTSTGSFGQVVASKVEGISSLVDVTLVSGSSTSTGSFGEVVVGGMSINSMTQFSSSVATKFNSLDGDIIALSIALG
jgi:hypothetical protein|tara:strand:- start:455 stop:769 length:315 start_codon:yes stop_codon:yes gene_type:complete